MERKQTTIAFIGRVSRWAAVLAIVLSVLSMQQSWAALACHCDSHNKSIAEQSQARHDKGEPETHHSACHHNACDGEGAERSHGSGDGDEDSAAPDSPAIPSNPTATVNSGPGAVSCCCLAQASPPEVSTLSFLTQQPTPIEGAPAVLVPGVSVTAVSINIHGPPRSARSRPLYIVQSSLLI